MELVPIKLVQIPKKKAGAKPKSIENMRQSLHQLIVRWDYPCTVKMRGGRLFLVRRDK